MQSIGLLNQIYLGHFDLSRIISLYPHIGKLHVHNIYNLVVFSNSHLKQLPKLKQIIALFLLHKRIILNNLNFHHPVYGSIETQSDNNAEYHLTIIEQHGLDLLLKSGTITYDKTEYQSIIDLIFSSYTIFSYLISCHISNDIKYGSEYSLILSLFNFETIEQPAILQRQYKNSDFKLMREVILRKSAEISNLPFYTKDDIDEFVE